MNKEFEIVAAVPILQTVSLRMVLDVFGESIVELEAEGGILESYKTTIDEEYGIDGNSTIGDNIRINYKQDRSLGGIPTNPLNDDGIERVLRAIESKLPPKQEEIEQIPPDIAVRKIVIEVQDQELAEIAAEYIDWFDGNRNAFLLTFENDPAEKQSGDQAKRPIDEVYARNRGLKVHYHGFKGRVLNLRTIIERARVYGDEEEIPIVYWKGPGDNFPKCDEEIGRHIYNRYLPDGYAELNYYYRDARDMLILDGWVQK